MLDTIYKVALIFGLPLGIYASYLTIRERQINIKAKLIDHPNLAEETKWNLKSVFKSYYFLVPLILLCGIVSGFSLKHFFFSSNSNGNFKKERIVVLMPFDAKARPVYQDGLRQLDGFAEYINKNDDKTMHYEFIPISHNNDPQRAKEIVSKEIREGTKYFISTMSMVDEYLSKEWNTILTETGVDTSIITPKLICTIASSPNIKTIKNLVYRFYIRSNDECKALVDNSRLQLKKDSRAFCIVVADNYGDGALKEYKTNLQSSTSHQIELANSVSLRNDLNYNEIKEKIKIEIGRYNPTSNDAVFIAHYGSGIVNIIRALFELKINSTVYSASALSIQDWQEPIKNELKSMNWFTCFPEYNTPQSAIYDKSKNDVIKNFTTYTIAGLIFTLDKLRNDPQTNFHENWQGAFGDMDFKVQRDDNDFAIQLLVVGKEFFKNR